jgi:hypothetical protein
MKIFRDVKYKKCKYCGNIWQVNSQNDKKKKFCSRQCYYKFIKGKKNPQWKLKETKECEYCHKTFSVWPSHSFRRFCSKACANKNRATYLYKS